MKSFIKTSKDQIINRSGLFRILLLAVLTVSLVACDRGRPGRPGEAWLALDWEDDKPDLIDAGTPDIPPVFQWGTYYRAYPGFYYLYYEGKFWNGQSNVKYAFEIEYEIWIDQGKPGGYYYDGDDGYDTYFTLICTPFGPFVDEYLEKLTPAGIDYKVISSSDEVVVIEYTNNEYVLRATYKKVVPRSEQVLLR